MTWISAMNALRSKILRTLVPSALFASVLTGGVPERDAFLKRYCLSCHNAQAKAGGLILESVSTADTAATPGVWEKVARKVRAREMPPPGMPRPAESSANAFVAGIIADLDTAARRTPFAGAPVIRRLNRTEYTNAIRDLLDINLPLAAELPQDQSAAGFDNIADALSMSPFLLERYLKVARRVSELATGTGDASPVVEIFPAKGTQAAWQGDGMPVGSRGGIRVTHFFPRDGEYEIRAFLAKESLTPTEGVRLFRTRVASIKAGTHSVIVTFPDEFAEREGPVLNVGGAGGPPLGGPLDVLGTAVRPTIDFRVDGRRAKLFQIAGMTAGEAAFDGLPGPPVLARIEIAGPHNPTGPGDTPSRRRIFVCRPAGPGDEAPCATRILSPLVRRAFRRPVAEADVAPFIRTFTAARKAGDFDAAIAAAIRDVILAPDFLFRLEFDPPNGSPRTPGLVTPVELATRLSFFLWSSIPDETLLASAERGALHQQPVLDQEVRRMIADPRANAFIDSFVSQWLGLRGLDGLELDKQLFPEFDASLAAAFQTETRLFMNNLIRENRSVLDVLLAKHTYLDERLANHYGIPGVIGPGFRRVALEDNSQRGGLLGHGSIMALTSHTTRTSPVLRGKWILDNLLNDPPPPPPVNVPPLDESPVSGRQLTAREQVERHRANPSCQSCHSRIDPLGFALENYDVIGRWRDKVEGGPIDASSKMQDGTTLSGPQGLKTVLTRRSGEFVQATLERLLTYALGRELDARDQPAIRDMMRETEATGHRFQDLILAVVKSVPFTMREKQER